MMRSAPLERDHDRFLAPVVVAAGSLLLLARPFASMGGDARASLFVASYVVIAAAAIALERTNAGDVVGRRRAIAVLVVGVAAVVAAALVAGPAVPAPSSILAVVASVVAAVAEEALFRGVAYRRLEPFGAAIAIVGSAALFALIHLPAYGTTAMPVDLGAGLLLGWQRYAARTWTVPAATHAFANILASLR